MDWRQRHRHPRPDEEDVCHGIKMECWQFDKRASTELCVVDVVRVKKSEPLKQCALNIDVHVSCLVFEYVCRAIVFATRMNNHLTFLCYVVPDTVTCCRNILFPNVIQWKSFISSLKAQAFNCDIDVCLRYVVHCNHQESWFFLFVQQHEEEKNVCRNYSANSVGINRMFTTNETH